MRNLKIPASHYIVQTLRVTEIMPGGLWCRRRFRLLVPDCSRLSNRARLRGHRAKP